jgi:hypothetical protein
MLLIKFIKELTENDLCSANIIRKFDNDGNIIYYQDPYGFSNRYYDNIGRLLRYELDSGYYMNRSYKDNFIYCSDSNGYTVVIDITTNSMRHR